MRTKNSLRMQKYIYYGFLIAAFLVVIASLCFVADGWIIFKAELDNDASGFFYELRTNLKLAFNTLSSSNIDEFYNNFEFIKNQGASIIDGTTIKNSAIFTESFASNQEAIDFYRNFWFDIQSANNLLFFTGIGTLALFAVCCICGSFSRKKYYISNLVSGVITGTFAIIMSILVIVKCASIYGQFSLITADVNNYLQCNSLLGSAGVSSTINGNNCFIGIITGVIFILLSAGFIAYNVYRFLYTKKVNSQAKEAVINE